MLKRLLLIWIFSGSLDGFSQDTFPIDIQPSIFLHDLGMRCNCWKCEPPKPDTLRAIILVTLSPNGIAHARMGYVVIADRRKPVYLTCDKKALKLPQVGWGWVEAGEGRR